MISSPKKNRLKGIIKFLLTVLVSGVCLYFAARKIEFARIKEDLKALNPCFFLLTALISFITITLRSWRWHLVLSREREFPFSTSFWATTIGYLGNNILPARAGEVIRSVVLGLGADIRKSLVLATALTERILDAGILLIIAFCMLPLVPQMPDSVRKSWLFLLPLIGGALVLAFVAPLMQKFWLGFAGKLPVGANLRGKIQELLQGLMDGVRVFYNVRLMLMFLIVSVGVWLIDGMAMLFLTRALGSEISLPQATIFIAALGFASSLPSTPGYVGVYQAVAVMLLPLFGISENRAFLMVSCFQLILLMVTAAMGIPGWFIMQKRIGAARLEKELAENG